MLKNYVVLFISFLVTCLSILFLAHLVQKKATNRIVSDRIVSERLITQIDFSSWIRESFKVSPDSKRVVYAARVGKKWLVVVNGKEGKRYDGIVGKIIFDSSDSLHYLAQKGEAIFLVEERIE